MINIVLFNNYVLSKAPGELHKVVSSHLMPLFFDSEDTLATCCELGS